jgi:hypothetical protein
MPKLSIQQRLSRLENRVDLIARKTANLRGWWASFKAIMAEPIGHEAKFKKLEALLADMDEHVPEGK